MNTETERLTAELVAAHARIAALSQQLDGEIAKRAALEVAASRAVEWMKVVNHPNTMLLQLHHPSCARAWQDNPCTCEFGRVLAGLEGK